MIIYSFDDIEVLTQLYEDTFSILDTESSNLHTPTIQQFSYHDQIKSIIEEMGDPGSVLMEFLGAYESAVNDRTSQQYLHEFLFKRPLDDMPLFISTQGEKTWKNMVAIWRLKIGK